MRLLMHFLAADLRRFRRHIGMWIVVFVAAAIVEAVVPSLVEGRGISRALGLGISLLRFADVALALSLVAVVVQAHPLVGSDAFWMTRPIRWDTLLVSKLVLLWAVLVAFPIAWEIVHMVTYGVPVAQIGLASVQIALFRTAALIGLMAVAAVTPDVARFALVCAGTLVTAAVIAVVGSLLFESRPYPSVAVYSGSGRPVGARERDYTWLVVGIGLGMAAASALLVLQYRSRVLGRSVAAGVSGVLLAAAIGMAWPLRLLSESVPPPPWAWTSTDMRLVAETDALFFDRLAYGDDPHWQLWWAPLRVQGVPTGWIAAARLQRASLQYENARLSSPGHTMSILLRFDDRHRDEAPLPATIRDVLGVRLFSGSIAAIQGPRALAFIADMSDARHDGTAAGAYRGEFMVDLTRIEVAAVLPLTPGAAFADGAYRIRLDEIRTDDPGVRIQARFSNVATIFDRTPRPTFTLFLRNKTAGEASAASMRRLRQVTSTPFAPGSSSGFSAYDGELFFPEMYRWPQAGALEFDKDWIGGAELVVLRSIYDGSVPRVLEMRNVRVEPASSAEVLKRGGTPERH